MLIEIPMIFLRSLHSLEVIMCHKFGGFIIWANSMNLVLFHGLRGAHLLNKGLWTFFFNMGLVKVIKVQNATLSRIFVNVVVSKIREHMRNCLSWKIICIKIILEFEPNDILVSLFGLDGRLVGFLWIEAKTAAVVELVHHHFVDAWFWEIVWQVKLGVF